MEGCASWHVYQLEALTEGPTRLITYGAESGESPISQWKARLFAVVIIVIFAAITYYNWQQLLSEGSYSLKMAAFGPVGVVGGIFLVFFPSKFGKPTNTMDKVLVLFVFGIGVLAGLVNWYLMDPGYFGR